MDGNLLEIKDLEVQFPIKKGILQRTVGHIHAVDKISFNIKECETLGLVGESGCGKTTKGRAILLLNDPSAGSVYYKNEDFVRYLVMVPNDNLLLHKNIISDYVQVRSASNNAAIQRLITEVNELYEKINTIEPNI